MIKQATSTRPETPAPAPAPSIPKQDESAGDEGPQTGTGTPLPAPKLPPSSGQGGAKKG